MENSSQYLLKVNYKSTIVASIDMVQVPSLLTLKILEICFHLYLIFSKIDKNLLI